MWIREYNEQRPHHHKQSDAFAQSRFVARPTLTMTHTLGYLGRASDHSD
jgi:hypothetical protein